MPALRAAHPAAVLAVLALLLTGCGSGPVTNVHSADGAEVLAHTEAGASDHAGEPGEGEAEGEAEGHGEDDASATEPDETAVDDEFLRALREQHVQALLLAEQQIASGHDAEATELARRVVQQQEAAIAEIERLLAA